MRQGVISDGEEASGGQGGGEGDFIALSPSLATSVAETFLFFLPLLFL